MVDKEGLLPEPSNPSDCVAICHMPTVNWHHGQVEFNLPYINLISVNKESSTWVNGYFNFHLTVQRHRGYVKKEYWQWFNVMFLKVLRRTFLPGNFPQIPNHSLTILIQFSNIIEDIIQRYSQCITFQRFEHLQYELEKCEQC